MPDRNRNIRGLISWTGPGNPFWDSYSHRRGWTILSLTKVEFYRRYFRCAVEKNWMRLKSAADFSALNRAVDAPAFGSAA